MKVRIKEVRTLKGMTLLDLAQASGVAEANISRIENHKQQPRPSTMRRLAKALGVEVADLWDENDEGKLAA